jgi:hypothetical protein
MAALRPRNSLKYGPLMPNQMRKEVLDIETCLSSNACEDRLDRRAETMAIPDCSSKNYLSERNVL